MNSTQTFDIVNMLGKNTLTRLNKDYESRLIGKIKSTFNENEQNLFVGSFYAYLKYDSKKDFVIDFDKVWRWTGFTRKDNAKRILDKHFVQDIDYKLEIKSENLAPQVGGAAPQVGGASYEINNLAPQVGGASYEIKNLAPEVAEKVNRIKTHGGSNTETILLSVQTFKKFCLKANTKKADEIHDYYIKLEEMVHEIVNEESDELRSQLMLQKEKNNEIEKKLIEKDETIKILKNEKQVIDGKNVVYLATTDDKESRGVYTVGKSVNLKNRLSDYNNNKLYNFKVVKYISCKSKQLMDCIERLILCKLNKFKMISDRDVFELPKGEDVKLFTQWYDYLDVICRDVEDDIVLEERSAQEQLELDNEYIEDLKEDKSVKNKAYRKENHEDILEREANFRDMNREVLRERVREYAYNNRETLNETKRKKYAESSDESKLETQEYMKKYRIDNAEAISKRRKEYNNSRKNVMEEPIKCVCGSTVARQTMQLHIDTKRHKDYLETGKTLNERRIGDYVLCGCGMHISKHKLKRHENSKFHKSYEESQKTEIVPI
jgi:hypothetical protein